MPGIYVIPEITETISPSGLEAITQARKLAEVLKLKVCVCLVGNELNKAVEALKPYGADEVYIFEDSTLAKYANEPYLNALADFLKERAPDFLFLPATTFGKDLAPGLAASLDTGMVSDCVDLSLSEGMLYFTRPIYAGKIFEKVTIPAARPQMTTLRAHVFEASKIAGPQEPRIVKERIVMKNLRSEVIDVIKSAQQKAELTQADIIVSGGRGLKSAENFKLLEELAAVLGAAIGASRAAVDAGWRPHGDQVGQTGKAVTPKLYIACGISGAIQHLVGISSSKCVLAINKDADAPIFKKADYGIVGNLFDVIPLLIEELKKH